MPIQKIRLQPGVDLQSSPTLNQTKWAVSQLIRFYEGLLQKIGGWQAYCATPVIGTCRALHGWADLSAIPYLATGTEQRLQVIEGGAPVDITPVYNTTNPAVAFSTTSGSATFTIADGATPSAGDWVNLITQVSVGGLLLQGFYQVLTSVTGSYTAAAASKATTTVAAGGAVPAFNVANASATVTVTLANHGQTTSPPSAFNLPLQTVLGSSGITLAAQSYLVNSVIDTGHFTITAATVASASATASLNGGDAQIEYLLSTGNASNLPGGGYGVGEYGEGNYGAANTVSGTVTMRVWSLDNYGQDLIASPNGGTIYYWQPGQTGPAVVVPSTPPTQCNWIFSIPEVQMVMALGVSSGGTQYPLLAAWCDTGGLFETNGWAPTATNQAGSFQLNSGSMLVFGAANGLTLYLWTDFGLWSVTYQGLPYVWSFNEMARECGAISSRAVAISAIGAAWLSSQGFFQLTGNGVQPMECPVWDFYVNNVDTSQLQAITSCLNTQFHEVSWQFPVIGGGYAEVKWNWLENVWDYTPAGLKPRTAWIDASPAGNPMGVDAAGLVQQHEIGYNANGQPLTPYAQTGFFDVADGDDYVFVDQIIPDFVRVNSAAVTLSVLRQSYPEAPTSIDGPYSITANNFITCNSRGRQLAIGMGSSDSNSFWRLGALRYRFRPDGKI